MSDPNRALPPDDSGLVPAPSQPVRNGNGNGNGNANGEKPTELQRIVRVIDTRTGIAGITNTAARKVFPDHWSFLFGEVALFCLVILVLTGTFMTFFFRPDSTHVIYNGSYLPLRGQEVSSAYKSVVDLSFDVRAGLLFRQIHHWTALVFLGVITLHMSRVFFTGAFRRPRELNWILGFTLLTFALAEGITGYSLPDDALSGAGLRIVYSVALSIPLIGPWVTALLFGGSFPGDALISRFFVFHVMLLPGLLLGAAGVHILLVFIQKHTQYPGPGKSERNVVGARFWPGQAYRSTGLFFLTFALVTLMAGFFQINPVWNYGPYIPYVAISPAQPDWYVGWLEGVLRISPALEINIFGFVIPQPFIPGVVIPGILMTGMAIWPFIERAITRDGAEHNLLEFPWARPARTALGAAVLTIFVVLTLAGGNDILSVFLHIPIETLTGINRVLIVAAPILVGVITYYLMRERALRGTKPLGPPAGVALRRLPDGGFEEVEP